MSEQTQRLRDDVRLKGRSVDLMPTALHKHLLDLSKRLDKLEELACQNKQSD